MTHREVIESSAKWVKRIFPLVFKEWAWSGEEQPDIIGFRGCETCLVEAKVSRSDFLRDKKKSFRVDMSKGMGDYRFYACPTGLIKKEELPENWGLIYVNEKGKSSCIVNPYCGNLKGNIWKNKLPKSTNAEYGIMYSIMRKII